jgi:hypothetical protein
LAILQTMKASAKSSMSNGSQGCVLSPFAGKIQPYSIWSYTSE